MDYLVEVSYTEQDETEETGPGTYDYSWRSKKFNHKARVVQKEERIGLVESIVQSLDVKPGDIVYVVYVLYTSGNSFGSSEGNVQVVGAYEDKERAEEVKNNPQNYVRYVKWTGYFEELESVELSPVIVGL